MKGDAYTPQIAKGRSRRIAGHLTVGGNCSSCVVCLHHLIDLDNLDRYIIYIYLYNLKKKKTINERLEDQ